MQPFLCGLWKIETCEVFHWVQCAIVGGKTREAFDWIHQKGVTTVRGRHARTRNNATLIPADAATAYICVHAVRAVWTMWDNRAFGLTNLIERLWMPWIHKHFSHN